MNVTKSFRTDKVTYNQYVEAGLWKPIGSVKFNSGVSGKVEAEVSVKGKNKFVTSTIIIDDYFYNKVDFRR